MHCVCVSALCVCGVCECTVCVCVCVCLLPPQVKHYLLISLRVCFHHKQEVYVSSSGEILSFGRMQFLQTFFFVV